MHAVNLIKVSTFQLLFFLCNDNVKASYFILETISINAFEHIKKIHIYHKGIAFGSWKPKCKFDICKNMNLKY